MKIRRTIIETEIDVILGSKVDKKSKRLVVTEIYNTFMSVLIDVLNDESALEYPERIREYWMERTGGQTLYWLLSNLTLEWVGTIRRHILDEGYEDGAKFKFKRSPLSTAVAVDQIVLDIDYTEACHKEKEIKRKSLSDFNDDHPDLETLNEYFELESQRERGRKDSC